MQESVALSLSERAVSLMAGGAPVSVQVTLTNRSRVVDQYDLTIEGGQPDWYEITPAQVSLFPGESASVTLNIHPPRRENVIAGGYQLNLHATSHDSAGARTSAALNLTIRPSGGFQINLPRARATGRHGDYRLHLANLSDAPLQLALSAQDPEGALTFYFPAISASLGPYEQRDIDFSVRPNQKRLKGEPTTYAFTVEATPSDEDVARSAANSQRVQGDFVFTPMLRHWPWEGVPRLMSLIVPLIGGGAALAAVLIASAGSENPPPPDIAATLTARDVSMAATAQAASALATKSVTQTPTPTPTPSVTPTPTVAATATRPPTPATSTPRPVLSPVVLPTRIFQISP